MVNYILLGRRIRSIRKEHNLTQETLSEMAGITPTNLSHIERGKTKPSVETLVALANALRVTMNDFLCDSLQFSTQTLENILAKDTQDCSAKELQLLSDITKVIKEHADR